MTTTETSPDTEVTWPDGTLFANRYHQTVFTYSAAVEIARHIGGDVRAAKTETKEN